MKRKILKKMGICCMISALSGMMLFPLCAEAVNDNVPRLKTVAEPMPVFMKVASSNTVPVAEGEDSTFFPIVFPCEAVDASYFDDAVFIGDSISLSLKYYCASSKALGNATFLAAGSLSASNALWKVSDKSVHPKYKGKKMLIEDSVADCGAKKVYIALGMNNISFGIKRSTGDMLELIRRIKEKSPDVQIYIQSVTPMMDSSSIKSNKLNNVKIMEYNLKMLEYCQQNGWYYINTAEAFIAEDATLRPEFCGDAKGMGIHFNTLAAQTWVDYLKTHVPGQPALPVPAAPAGTVTP